MWLFCATYPSPPPQSNQHRSADSQLLSTLSTRVVISFPLCGFFSSLDFRCLDMVESQASLVFYEPLFCGCFIPVFSNGGYALTPRKQLEHNLHLRSVPPPHTPDPPQM